MIWKSGLRLRVLYTCSLQAHLLHQQNLGSKKDCHALVPILVQAACLVLDEQHRHQSFARPYKQAQIWLIQLGTARQKAPV